MAFSVEKREKIIFELLKYIKYHPKENCVNFIVNQYGISKQTVYNYISRLKEKNILAIDDKKQLFVTFKVNRHEFYIHNLEEDVVWSEHVKPLLSKQNKNIIDACSYGFTEILNNAIDHSGSEKVAIEIVEDYISIMLRIRDDGIGIFNKIQSAFSLETPHHAILELSKGKCTTDPRRHSGEGIFFTSRIFDCFVILSGDLHFFSTRKLSAKSDESTDLLLENSKHHREGTLVHMEILKDSNVSIQDIFEEYTSIDDESFGFSKTIISVHLIDHKDTIPVSRSQAKRLMKRGDKFKEIVLDFEGINEIGQAFADEIFRVFKLEHPEIRLSTKNTSVIVQKMIDRALNSSSN